MAIPESYTDLPFTQIKVSHHPAASPTVTPVIIVTLYRPKAYNAFNFTIQKEMEK
jgi:hypothetical protein